MSQHDTNLESIEIKITCMKVSLLAWNLAS